MINAKRLFDIPNNQLKDYPSEKMFVTKTAGKWVPTSTKKFMQDVMAVSKGLIAKGIQQNDKVAIVSNTRYEWNVMDIAIQQVAAIVVPIYPNISKSDYKYIFNDAEIKLAVISNEELFTKISEIRSEISTMEHLYTMETVEGAINWDALKKAGQSIDENEVRERMKLPQFDELATIIYTSGTTGSPKGVMLSHKNLISNVSGTIEPIPAERNSPVLTFLPACHVYERMLHYLYMHLGCSIHFAESMETIGDNIREVHPHVFSAVPRLIEKVYDKIMAKGEELSGIKKGLFYWAVRLAERYDPVNRSAFYNFKLAIARKLIFSKWKIALGGDIKAIASGSAALQPRLARIFLAAGIPILEGYGLTETSPVISVNSFTRGLRPGSVGPLIDDVEVKIAEDGEILVKGPNVMMGYYNLPDQTAEVLKDGWFHTGDIGEFQEGIFLKITDRKKEIFKTSGGKYIIPQAMENKFKESRFIEQVMIIGEGQKFPAALIVPNFHFVIEWGKRHDLKLDNCSSEEIISNEKVIARIQKVIEKFNTDLGNWEKIKQIELMSNEFSVKGGELTPTLKLKRKAILVIHKNKVENIYGKSE